MTDQPPAPDRHAAARLERVRFGARVRELRDAAGLSQSELARRTGIDRPSLHRLEAGDLDIGVTKVSRLAQALAVPPGALFDSPTPGQAAPQPA